jgi:hypothetical protein
VNDIVVDLDAESIRVLMGDMHSRCSIRRGLTTSMVSGSTKRSIEVRFSARLWERLLMISVDDQDKRAQMIVE